MAESTHNNAEQMIPLIAATLALDEFQRDWAHCDQLSNYLAQFVSADRHNPTIFTNRVSTVLNEVLEVIYHHNAGDGVVEVTIGRYKDDIYLEFTVPVNDAERRFYDEALGALEREDPRVLYRQELERLFTAATHPAMGLYELAADYGARFEKRQAGEGKFIMSLSLPISRDEV